MISPLLRSRLCSESVDAFLPADDDVAEVDIGKVTATFLVGHAARTRRTLSFLEASQTLSGLVRNSAPTRQLPVDEIGGRALELRAVVIVAGRAEAEECRTGWPW